MELTDREVAIMRVLWDGGPQTAAQIQRALPGRQDNSSVRTFLRILEQKGHVAHRKRGRAFVYRARMRYDQAVRGEVDRLVGRFFDGSMAALRQWVSASSTRRRRPAAETKPEVTKPDDEPTPAEDPHADSVWLL